MPRPVAPPEAYYVAIVFGGSLMPDVFTLEASIDPETDATCVSFCEWKVDGTHEILARHEGTAADPSEFVRAIIDHLGL
jgi:hypothetical protein